MPETRMSLSCYRPRPERDAQLRELFSVELATLRAGGHVTDRRVPICRTDAGDYLVILEWAHEDAVDDAHRDPAVLRVWAQKAELSEYLAPADLTGSDIPFVSYRVVGEA